MRYRVGRRLVPSSTIQHRMNLHVTPRDARVACEALHDNTGRRFRTLQAQLLCKVVAEETR
jgi:hypothetical protein